MTKDEAISFTVGQITKMATDTARKAVNNILATMGVTGISLVALWGVEGEVRGLDEAYEVAAPEWAEAG